jgi:hypothetical protein
MRVTLCAKEVSFENFPPHRPDVVVMARVGMETIRFLPL